MYPHNDIRTDSALYTRELQLWLRRLSEEYPTLPRVNPDGVYGPATASAVEQFQRRFGLPVTRQADLLTWEAVRATHATLSPTMPPDGILPAEGTLPLALHSTGSDVHRLNGWLNELADYYPHLPRVTPGAYYDADTAHAVETIQPILLLPATGIVDAPTWHGIGTATAHAHTQMSLAG